MKYKQQCLVPQLAYVLAHDKQKPTNSTRTRVLDGIYVQLLSNAQGGHEVMRLETIETIHRRNATEVQITPEIIKATKALEKRDGTKPFKMDTKHGVTRYHVLTARVGSDGEEVEGDINVSDDNADKETQSSSEENDEMDQNK